jgi:hypothetical protein
MYIPSNPGVPNLGDASPWGDARDLKSVMSWVHLYQWMDATDVWGDALQHGFPTCGMRTTSGTQRGLRWYAKSFWKLITISTATIYITNISIVIWDLVSLITLNKR